MTTGYIFEHVFSKLCLGDVKAFKAQFDANINNYLKVTKKSKEDVIQELILKAKEKKYALILDQLEKGFL